MSSALSVTVVIPTYRRARFVRECLQHLARLATPPLEVLVVDASPDGETAAVVAEHAARLPVRYLRNELGPGTTPESRAMGVAHAAGDVVAFVDDDAYPQADWLDELLVPYADPAVAGVGGRIVNGADGETEEGLDRIGRLLPDGRLTGYFTADPGRPVAVHHFLGANMSYRRDLLLEVGGVRGRYPGPCVCEETDIALRQHARGRRLVYTPSAVVRHVSAPYSIRGDRFDRRWHFYARRNHLAMLLRVFGPSAPVVRRFAVTCLLDARDQLVRACRTALSGDEGGTPLAGRARVAAGLVARTAVELTGLLVGAGAGVTERRRDQT